MNIQKYFKKLNDNSQEIYQKTVIDSKNLGNAHHISSFLYEFSDFLHDDNEKKIIITVASQLESATLNLTYGMYRQAFSSLRLAFELGLGAIHFSIHKLEQKEWLTGSTDIKWSKLIDEDNGVLSERFSKSFFEELTPEIKKYNNNSKIIYRKMSEFVHGNNETWTKSGLIIKYNENLKNEYFINFKQVSEILIFLLCCRYIKTFNQKQIDSISVFLLEEMKHISSLREFLGGAKEL